MSRFGLQRVELLCDLGRDGEALAALLPLLQAPPFEAGALDQLTGLLSRGAALAAGHLEGIVDGVRAPRRAADLLALDAARRGAVDPAGAAEQLRHAQALDPSPERHRALRAALVTLGDPSALRAFHAEEIDRARAAGDADGELAAQRALVAALGALGDGASEALALGTLAQLLLDRGQRTESGAVFARLGTLRAAAGEERAALDACAEAVALGHDAALDIAEALARQLADPRVLAGLLERRLELMAMPAGSAARPEIYGELSRLYRGPLAAPELAERTLRRALAAGAAPSEDLEALIELLRQEGRAAEVAALLERCGHELAVQGDLGAAAVLLTRAAEEFEVHGDPQSALGPRREGVTLDRTPARLLALADACHGLGLEAEAASLYAELCEIDPLPPFRVLERRAESLRQSQDPQRLAAFLEDHASATATATTAAWLREAATVRHGLGDLDAELRDLRAAFDADPSQSEVFAALVARGGVSDTTGWAELLRRRASAVPAEAVTLLRSAGDLVLHAGRVAEAIDLFDEALSVAPEDALALAGRIEVATLMHQPCESWVAQLLVVLGEGRGGEGAAAEALPRAAAALLSGGLPDAAQRLLEIAPVLPAAVREGALFVALRDQVAQARGDRRGQLTARRDRLARTAPGEAPPALEALLAVVLPEDPEAVAIYRHAWDVQGVPHSTALANKLLSAFDCMSARADPEAEAAFLESLLDADLLPTSTAEDRVSWAVRAAEIRLQKLANREAAGWLFERAIDDATTSPTLLRRLLAMALPAAPRAKLLGVAAAEGEGSQRAEWLLERARLSDESLSPAEAAAAWDAVLREGSGSPGYAQALERTLTRALAEERFADAANALVAQAEVAEGGAARAQLLEKAAQIHESQLGDVSRALELFQRAAAESGDVRWFTLLAEAYDRAGRTAEAAAALAVEVARREPGERRRERQRKLGLMLARELNRPGDALIHLRAVVSADAPGGVDDPALFEALADSARAVGNDEAELLGLSRMARSTGREALTTRDLRRAALLEALGRSAEAAELWTSILEVEPANALAFAPLAGRLRERKAWRELAAQLGRHATALGAVSPGASAAPRVALLVEQGEILLSELADRKEAERVFREALALEPATPRALAALRHLVDVRGDQRELLVLLEAQLALTTEDAAAAPLALQLGEVALRLGEPQLARRGLRRALAGAAAAEPGLLAQVRPLLARVELDLGDFKEALAQAEAALDAGPLEAAPLLVVAGQAASQLGEGLRALGHFRMLLQEQPGHPEALAGLELLSHDSEAGLAGEALSQRIAHESDPSRKARALRDLGRLRETLGDPVGAESALRESVKLDPDGEDGFAQLRQLLESEGRYPELAEVLRERARGTTDEIVRAALLVEQAELLRTHLADPLRAAEAYQRSLEILPRASTSEGYAEALFALGRDELAAEHYRRALGGGGHLGEFFLLYRLGDLARRANDKAGALEQYRKSAEANPSFLPAREALIDLAEELGNGELALAALRAMVEQLDPHEFAEQVVESHLRIAELQKRALHFDAAAESLEKASELRPEDERPLQRLAALYQNGSRWVDAVRVLERVAALKSGPESAVPLTVAGEITLDKLADMERASLLFDRALQASPDQESALRRSLEMAAALGQQERLLPLADQVLAIYFGPAGAKLRPSPAWLDELFLPIAQAFEQAGRIEDAYGVLVLARERSPGDLALLDHQATLAKRSGRFGEEADLEAQLIERIVSSRPLEAATRLRILARRVLEKLDDSDRAREMLYRAAALAPARPEDRRLLADLQRQTTDPLVCGQALETYLELVRRDPTLDLVLLRVLAATAAEQDRPELSQTALSLVAALEGATVGAAPTLTPLPQSAWAIGSLAGEGGIELVLQTLAPYLEPLFPVQLARYGVSGVDRVGPGHAPELHQWVDRARESLGARPTDVYLSPSLKGVALENSHPPSLLIGAQAVQALGQGGMQWLLCQRLALSELGFTLPAKFSPKDVTTLAALATLYLTDDAPVPMADRQRLHVFLEALRRSCPEAVRQTLLGQAARTARELHAFDPHRYIASALARANRLALLVTGDLRSALAALDYLDGGDAPRGRPWELPQGKALIEWAFSEEHNALRRLALGKQPR